MKAKHFNKLRKKCKWYYVAYREDTFDCLSLIDMLLEEDEKETRVLARSMEEACMRYHKRTGCFVNKRFGNVEQYSKSFSRFRVRIGNKISYFD